jgi:hypothetical protein
MCLHYMPQAIHCTGPTGKFHNNQRTREVTKTEASEILKNLMGSIQQDIGFLMTKCKSYGNMILDLWTAKSLPERKALWLEVIQQCISIDEKEANIRQSVSEKTSSQEYGASGTSTYCPASTSKLSGKPLHVSWSFFLLSNGVKYLAESWAPYDTPWLRLSQNTGVFGILFNRNCVVVQGSKYGESIIVPALTTKLSPSSPNEEYPQGRW